MKLSMMGCGLPIIQEQEGVNIPADKRLPKSYKFYKIKEDVLEMKLRQLKEQRLADMMGLKLRRWFKWENI